MRVTVFILAVCTTPLASAAVYYVDSVAGSDSQDGRSVSTPWQTLSRIESTTFAPGDYILLKRSSVWYEPLAVPSSGMQDAPITVAAYGTGPNPIIDGSALALGATDLLVVNGKNDIVLSNLQLRNGPLNGVNISNSSRITLRGLAVSANRSAGIEVFDSNSIVVETSEIFGNSLDTSVAHDGVRIDGSGIELSGFVVRNCYVHDNKGGEGWNSANGIFIGHTGGAMPVLRGVRILANELAFNGNPDQNQAGRNLTGTFTGDITVTGNYIHDSASAGLYLGNEGVNVAITLSQNIFYNNALRQFGGYTTNIARAFHNAIFVDNGSVTAMGAEVGGAGAWQITNNVFYYQTTTADTYRGYIRLNDQTQDANLVADHNLYYSPGPNRWFKSDDVPLAFPQWQNAGYDPNSVNPH